MICRFAIYYYLYYVILCTLLIYLFDHLFHRPDILPSPCRHISRQQSVPAFSRAPQTDGRGFHLVDAGGRASVLETLNTVHTDCMHAVMHSSRRVPTACSLKVVDCLDNG